MKLDINIVPKLLKFKSCVSHLFRHLSLYVFGLVKCERKRKNIQNICEKFPNVMDQSSLNRFLTQYKWSTEKLNHIRLKEFLPRKRTGILIVDDSLIEKTGKRMEGVGYLRDHKQKKDILCHDVVSTHFTSKDFDIPLHLEPYIKKGVAKKIDREFKTRIDIAIELLKAGLKYVNPIAIIFDAWYLAQKLVKSLPKGQIWISRLKSNRLVWDDEWTQIKSFASRIPENKFRKTDIEVGDDRYQWYTSITVTVSKLGKCKVIILKKKRDSKSCVFLVSNATSWQAPTIIDTFKNRHVIEEFYRESKQHLGMEDYQMRNMNGVVKHLHLVFLASVNRKG